MEIEVESATEVTSSGNNKPPSTRYHRQQVAELRVVSQERSL